MSERPASPTPGRPRKRGRDVLLFVVFVIFVILALGSMLAIDYFGEKRMGDASKVQDAPDDH